MGYKGFKNLMFTPLTLNGLYRIQKPDVYTMDPEWTIQDSKI